MAAKVVDPTPGVSSTDKDLEESQDHDRNNETIISLERKDSLKARTLQKRGHLRLKEDGQTTYKRTSSSAIVDAIQLGIGYSVGRLSAKQERDILMQDFNFVEKVWFPASGSRETPSHRYVDFKFKSYAPSAFRYFRDLFGMLPSDFLMALSNEELREISNPGASGSMFFLSADDNFIIKTVQHKEATFLQQLLPGYYMNLHQNPRTLLPKFFGLYCYQSQNKNIRLAVMNNILPTTFKCHQVYDLKGSTFKRKASKKELTKKTPTKKDLDFRSDYPEGITMDGETYDAVVKTIRRDCRVLESFKIMDYSLLLGIHNIDQALREKNDASTADTPEEEENPERVARRAEFTAALEAIQIDKVEGRPLGGIPAKSPKGDRLILFLGVIDILQSYRLAKKLEHGWKSLVHDGDSVSVHNPSFYAKRFVDFVVKEVFKVIPSAGKGLNKRRSVQRQNQSGTSSTPGGKFRSVQGSFSDSTTPRGKDVKPKTPVVKFSEPMVINDEPPLDQMIPPPYESEVSTVSQDSATTATETSVVVSSEPLSEGGSSNTEPRQLETTVVETELSTVDTSVVEGRQESEHQVTEVSESVQSEHVVIVQSEHQVVTTIESEHTEQSEHKEEDVSRLMDAENTVEVAAPETRGESSSSHDNQPIASLDTSNRVSSHNGDSPINESAETHLVEPTETNDVNLTLDTSYDVIEYPGNHTVTTTTTKTITKTVTVIENGEEHIVTSEGDNGVTENHVVEFVKTAHVQDEDEEVLAGNSKPTLKLTDVRVQVDSDNNESLGKNKLLDCEEVTVM